MNNTFCESPDILALVGSHLYGVQTPTSDIDLRGFVAEPRDLLIGLRGFDQKEYENADHVVYGMKKFFKILMGGNTNALEVLFANEYRHLSPIGQLILDNRHVFITMAYYRALRGFALCEWRKARAVSLTITHEDADAADIFARLSGKYQLKRYELNDIMDTIFLDREGDPRKETPSTRKLGDRRKQDVESHGFSLKNAYHAIRLLDEGVELLVTGRLTFPRQNAAELRAIRAGQVSAEDLEKRFTELDQQLKESAEVSSLPKHPDFDAINKLYLRAVQMKLDQEAVVA